LTIQEIINYVDRKIINSETDANKVIDLNRIQDRIFNELGRLSNTYTIDVTKTTTSGTAEYSLVTGVRIEDIVKMQIEESSGGEYLDVDYAGVNDDIYGRRVYMRGSDATKFYYYDNEVAVTTTGLKFKIIYYPRPATLEVGTLTKVPDLDTDFHDLLCFGLIVELASQGDNYDKSVADYYQQKYDEAMFNTKKQLSDRMNEAFTTDSENQEWW